MIKKIVALVLLLVLGKMSYSQYPISQNLGSDSTLVISKGALQSRLINVTYTDTAAANLQRICQYPGAQIATTTGGLNLWIRNANATAWTPVATGSGNNIYTIDGTLLGNRTLTGAGYSLTFNQLSKLLFNADSATINTDQATILNNGLSTLSVKGAGARTLLVDTTAPADERIYELKSSNGEFFISLLNDAQTSNDSAFLITSASRVGINTTNPDSTLKVGGGVNILGGLRINSLPTSPGTKQLRINAQGQVSLTDTLIDAGGTVTSIATNNGSGITGGTITTTGTLAIDTTIISTKANVSGGLAGKLNISDTAAMLAPYLRAIDTASLSNRINTKLNISDTASMLANYLNNVGYGLDKAGQVASVDTLEISTRAWRQKGIDSVAALPRVTSVGLTMPAAFNVAGSPVTSSGTLAVTAAGLASQYIRGDGQLADFPGGGGGGGSSVSYYLNGSVNQGTFGGNTYYEMNKTPILGAGTNFSIAADGYIAQFITDAGDPGLLNIPAGNWNLETYFSASSSGGTPSFYVELYKYNGTTFTLIASNSTNPEFIAFGTTVTPYFSALAVPQTTLSLTDRLAIRIYVVHSGRTITLHTENSNLCQIITTFSTGITALNGLTAQVQYFATGTSGTDFGISSVTDTHTFNLPVASATNTGKLSNTDWSTFNNKIGGTLVSGYLTKATGTSTIDTSQLYQGSGLIGIGTTSPTQKLQVSGNAFINGQLFAGDTALSVYQVEGILSTPYVLGRKAVDNTLSTEARPTGIQGHVVGRGSIANRLQGGTFYATTDSASTANSTGSLRASNSWSAHNGSGSLANAWGSYNIVQNKTTGTITNAYGSVSGVENRGATSTINKLHGTTTEIWNNYGGTIDTAFGQVISIYNNNASSNIGAVYGLSVGKGLVSPTGGTHYWRNSGTIGTSYGIYLDTSIDVGATKYSIFSNSNSDSYFKGKLGVGTTSPDSAFQVATGAYFQRGIRASALPQAPGTKALRIDASGTISYADTLIDAGGTVTSVATNNGTGITGGTITTTGTLAIDTLLISTRAWRQKGVDSLQANINLKLNISDTASMLANYITGPQTFSGYMAKFNGGGTIDTSRIFQNNGLVGINTTGPSYSLDVLGTGRFTSNSYFATSSGVVGIGTTSADSLLTVQTGAWIKRGLRLSGLPTGTGTKSLRVDANGTVSLADTLANGISGTGTTNYIPKFTSSSAIGNSTIFDNGSNIGLGTASPLASYRVTISGSTYQGGTDSKIYIDNGGVGGASAILGVVGTSYGYLNTDGAFPFVFQTNNTERLRISSTGNVSIGNTNNTYKLDVTGTGRFSGDLTISKATDDVKLNLFNTTSPNGKAWYLDSYSNGTLYFGNAGGNYFNIASTGAATFSSSVTATAFIPSSSTIPTNGLYLPATNTLGFATNSTERMRLDASGNLGLGVTPSAWYSLSRAIDIGAGGAIQGRSNASGTFELTTNAYLNSSGNWAYKASSVAANLYSLSDGSYKWYQAPSGTANTSISFTQAMTLDASGRLGIGTTSPSTLLEVAGVIRGASLNVYGSTDPASTSPYLYSPSTGALGIGANGSERMRITSGGLVNINTTNPSGRYLSIGGDISVGSNNTNTYELLLQMNSSYARIGPTYQTGGSYVPLTFWTSDTERMRITSAGDVGIGTTTPGAKLEVNGAIKTAAPSGGTAVPWKLGSAGVALGGSNLSGVEVEINGTTYYLVTGYLPEPEPDPAALPASGPSGSYKTYNKPTPVKSAQDAKIQALERELAELKEMVKKLASK